MLWASQNCGKLHEELQIRQKFEKWKNLKLQHWSPETASILSQGPPRSLRQQKRNTNADALPRNTTFRLNFRPRGQFGASLGENRNYLYYYAGPFLLGGDHIPTSNKVFRVFLKRYGAIFHPRNGCFGLKTPILGSHIIHISHSVSW